MDRTIEEAAIRRHHHAGHDQLRGHLADFPDAHNFAGRLKTLGGLAPFEFIRRLWT